MNQAVTTTTKRHVFHVSGCDTVSPDRLHRRFCRETPIFSRTWNVETRVGPIEACDGHPCWTVTTRGRNWAVNSTVEPLDWRDIVLADLNRPFLTLLREGFRAAFDFAMSGTVARYFKSSPGYAIFFLGPYLTVLFLAIASIGLGGIVNHAFENQRLLAVTVSLLSFPLLVNSVGRRLWVQHGLADWAFSRSYAHGERQDVIECIRLFADRIAARAAAGDVDEIVCIGHSMGAILLIEAVAQVLDRKAEIGRNGVKLTLLTVGSTMPKLSLHPAAVHIRRSSECVSAQSAIDWVEYQSRGDLISFYKFHPVALRAIDATTDAIKPDIRRVRMREMLSARTLWSRRLGWMRMHYQFVMANERRASYDYFMFVCGPLPAADLVRAPRGPVGFLTAEGALCHETAALPVETFSTASVNAA